MILVINTCAEKLHYFEFVKPVEDTLLWAGFTYSTSHYEDIKDSDLAVADKIIICGTSLKDGLFVNNIDRFKWIMTTDRPLLGICAGMQIIGILHGGTLKSTTEIGFYKEYFKGFLGLTGEQEVFHLHNYYVEFELLNEFEIFSQGTIAQAVKHTEKPVYGVLFHPEVRQRELITNFCNL
jgi:anthranilate/para-aminobenzoate synthase component II